VSVFVDTSGFYANLDSDDTNHAAAARHWAEILRSDNLLITTNYVIVETDALVQKRLGMPVARRFHGDVLPVLRVVWVDEGTHSAAVSATLASGRRGPSLVDCTSFEVMRREGIERALAFDQHFRDRGYGAEDTDVAL
jgi:predicted nucleic acid-binding protein